MSASARQRGRSGCRQPQTYEVEDVQRLKLRSKPSDSRRSPIGAIGFGAAIGGGSGVLFTDMLGNHSARHGGESQVRAFGGSVALSRTPPRRRPTSIEKRRWNWGVVGGQVPYVSGGFRSGFGSVDGEPRCIDQTDPLPADRAQRRRTGRLSAQPRPARRVPGGRFARSRSIRIVQTQAYSLNTGSLMLDETDRQSLGETLTLGTSRRRSSSTRPAFGATSPVQGQRYRFEVAPTFGDINFTSLLARLPALLHAGRRSTRSRRASMHYGRYGSGGEDARLYPAVSSATRRSCAATTSDSYDSERMRADEHERLPGLSIDSSAAACWSATSSSASRCCVPSGRRRGCTVRCLSKWRCSRRRRGLERRRASIVRRRRTTGASRASARRCASNLLGFAIGEFDFARPLQRDRPRLVFQFNLSPGILGTLGLGDWVIGELRELGIEGIRACFQPSLPCIRQVQSRSPRLPRPEPEPHVPLDARISAGTINPFIRIYG